MAERANKLRRLDEFRRKLPYVSASALAAILAEAKREMPELVGRKEIRQARDKQVDAKTEYGLVLMTLSLECIVGTYIDMYVLNPFAQLWVAAQCEGFSLLLEETLRNHPCSADEPWNVILYSDEVVPGNQLSFHNLRKCWVVYFSFLEFGPQILSHEDSWFCTAAERSDRVKTMVGGMGQVFREILKLFFTSESPVVHNFMTSGVKVNLFNGASVRIWARLKMVLQDGGAHKHVFMLKGDGGHKFCVACRNLFSETSGIVGEDDEEILTCNLHFAHEMDFASDADVRGTVQRLANVATNRPAELKNREIACGFNHNKCNMLLEPSLDEVVLPVSVMAHDWMHTFVVHGVWNTIMFLLLSCLGASAHVQVIGDFVKEWIFPKRLRINSDTLADAFSERRWKSSTKAKYFKCTASDAMSLYAIVAVFFHCVYLRAGEHVEECVAYLALCDVLDLLVMVALGVVTADKLEQQIDAFLAACIKAGWRAYMHPKFHWCVHLARELRIFGILLTCWVHERKHKIVKQYTNNQRNTRKYEHSVLAEVTCQHFYNLSLKSTFDMSIGLREPTYKISPETKNHVLQWLQLDQSQVHDCVRSSRARVSKFEIVHVEDVAIWTDGSSTRIGKIILLARINNVDFAILADWPVTSKDESQGTVETNVETSLRMCYVEDIITAVVYRYKTSNVAQIIVPCLYRSAL